MEVSQILIVVNEWSTKFRNGTADVGFGTPNQSNNVAGWARSGRKSSLNQRRSVDLAPVPLLSHKPTPIHYNQQARKKRSKIISERHW